MAIPFSRSLRSLEADGFGRWTLSVLLVGLLLAGWSAWFLFGSVGVYEVTPHARLEVDRAVHPVEAPIGGRVVAVQMTLGQEVHAGDVLVELESDSELLRLEEERARVTAAGAQLA